MPRAEYQFNNQAAAASIAASTTKTIVGAKAHANSGLLLLGYTIGFDGVTASDKPFEIDICYCTWATNSPGTNSTTATSVQVNGRVLTAGFTAGYNWTAEPTALTVIEQMYWDTNKGQLIYDVPLGDEWDCALAEGFAIRVISPSGVTTVNCFASMTVCRN
jgi:hypothetical protein